MVEDGIKKHIKNDAYKRVKNEHSYFPINRIASFRVTAI